MNRLKPEDIIHVPKGNPSVVPSVQAISDPTYVKHVNSGPCQVMHIITFEEGGYRCSEPNCILNKINDPKERPYVKKTVFYLDTHRTILNIRGRKKLYAHIRRADPIIDAVMET